MICRYCKSTAMQPSTTTHVVTPRHCIIIVRNVPCEECVQCGEKYYSDEVMERLEEIVSQAKLVASEILVTDYQSVA